MLLADDLIELQFGADLFFEVEFLLGESVFEFRNLPIRQGIFEGNGYLARRLAEELDKARTSNEIIATPIENRSRHRFDGVLRWPD